MNTLEKLKKFKKKSKTQLESLDDRITELEDKIEELPDIITHKILKEVKVLSKKIIKKNIPDEFEELEKKVYARFHNKLFDWMKNISRNIVKETIIKKVKWETKIVKIGSSNAKSVAEMYKDGWKVAFSGSLRPKEYAKKQEDIIIYERPIFNESKKKKKVKRIPV